MEVDSDAILTENLKEKFDKLNEERQETMYSRTRALLVALLGLSVSACCLTSEPTLLQHEEAKGMSSINSGRRMAKPLIRFVLGPSRLSAIVTATSSLLLMIAVMSKEAWWQHGARWLAAPALLAAAAEVCADAADAALTTALLLIGSAPARAVLHAASATLLIAAEFFVWFFIAKFFENTHRPSFEEGRAAITCPTKTLARTETIL